MTSTVQGFLGGKPPGLNAETVFILAVTQLHIPCNNHHRNPLFLAQGDTLGNTSGYTA
jgi:hypothetical protein